MKEFKKISIIGCGWLGMPLAEKLITRGFTVKGSTTHTEKLLVLEQKQIKPFLLNLDPELEQDPLDFFESEVLIIDIPPKISLKGLDFHVKQIENLVGFIQKSTIKLIVFTSSTSVYPEKNKEVFEEDATETAHEVLWKAENMLRNIGRDVVVLRLAGLMGYDRIPAKYFAGRKGLTFGETPVNYIHRDDAVGVITALVESGIRSGTFNVVASFHPLRKEVYYKNCADLGFEIPEFIDAGPQNYKIINGDKLTHALEYTFVYANPLDFFYLKD